MDNIKNPYYALGFIDGKSNHNPINVTANGYTEDQANRYYAGYRSGIRDQMREKESFWKFYDNEDKKSS